MSWVRKPAYYLPEKDGLIMESEPHTVFDGLGGSANGALGLLGPQMRLFTFSVNLQYQFRGIGNECGILIRQSDEFWFKAGIEKTEGAADLTCQIHALGNDDRSSREIAGEVSGVWMRVLYGDRNLRVQYSFNGDVWRDLRRVHTAFDLAGARAGIYMCSPGDTWFECRFFAMKMVEL